MMNTTRIVFGVTILSLCAFDTAAQTANSVYIFRLLNSGKAKKVARIFEGDGSIGYNNSKFNGRILIEENTILLTTESNVMEFKTTDTAIQYLTIQQNEKIINLFRLGGFDNQLWRLLKDTLGVQVFDKDIYKVASSDNIDYSSLLFQKGTAYAEAETFWTTSTKKNIVRIINQLFLAKLKPVNFKGKEDLMKKIIIGDKSVYQ